MAPAHRISFIGLLHPGPGTGYGVTVPDLPGCTSGGPSLDAAAANAVVGLTGHLEAMIDDGDPVPEPRSLQDLIRDPEVKQTLAEGSMFVQIPVLVHKRAERIRINLRIDEDLVQALDDLAARLNTTRTALFTDGARQLIAQHSRRSDP